MKKGISVQKQGDNTHVILEKYNKSTDDILGLLKEVINKLNKMETLSIYRDFVTMFLEDIEARLGVNKWATLLIGSSATMEK